jgi:proteasome lid subunit RPN8/RPN11
MRVARGVYDEMVAHAQEERPFECCGLMAGTSGEVTVAHRTKNAADLYGIRYEIDPREFMRLNREIDDADLDLIGVTDVGAAWEGMVYLIVSLTDFTAPVVKAFTVADGQVTEQPMEIV